MKIRITIKIKIKIKIKIGIKNRTKTKNKWGYKGIQTKRCINGSPGAPSGRALRVRPPGMPSGRTLPDTPSLLQGACLQHAFFGLYPIIFIYSINYPFNYPLFLTFTKSWPRIPTDSVMCPPPPSLKLGLS